MAVGGVTTITILQHDSLKYWDLGPEVQELTVTVDSEETTPNYSIRKLVIKGLQTVSQTPFRTSIL